MPTTNFLMNLKQLFSDQDCQTILSCLHQDPLIWESLGDAEFNQKVLSTAGNDVREWNPATLVKIAISSQYLVNDFQSFFSKPLEPHLRQKAVAHFELALLSERKPENFDEASLIALALKERHRLKNSWQGIRDELTVMSDEVKISYFDIWATPIACVYSMTSDADDLLKSLLLSRNNERAEDFIGICAHSILCCPLSLSEQSERITTLIKGFPQPVQLQFLYQLKIWNRVDLVKNVAGELLKTEGFASYFYDFLPQSSIENFSVDEINKPSGDPLMDNESSRSIEKLQLLSAFYLFAGQTRRAEEVLAEARTASRQQEARLVSQMAQIASVNSDFEISKERWEQATQLVPDSALAKRKLAETLITLHSKSNPNEDLAETEKLAIGKMTRLKLALEKKDQSVARSVVRDILCEVEEQSSITPRASKSNFIFDAPKPSELLPVLIELDMLPEAVEIARKLLSQPYVDKQSTELAVKTFLKNKIPAEAIDAGMIATIISPNDLNSHRLLAEAFESAEQNEKAFTEREYITEHSEAPAIDDQLDLASVALKTNRYDKAISLAENILSQDSENGRAHHLLGKALVQSQDPGTAVQHFAQATLLSPELVEPWLDLSQAYTSTGEYHKSLETLRLASQAVPESPAVLFALGKTSLQAGHPSEALPILRKVFILDEASPDIVNTLSGTLIDLGHFDEAEQVLSQARKRIPDDPKLAYLHGQVQLALGNKAAAHAALMNSIDDPISNPDPVILAAQVSKALIEEEHSQNFLNGIEETDENTILPANEIFSIIHALKKVLEIEPTKNEARILLAELSVESRDYKEAFDGFIGLSEQKKSADTDYQSRILGSLWKAAFGLGKQEFAITSLQEGCEADPENIDLRKSLATALRLANLNKEALASAKSALQISEDDTATAIWYARTALALGATTEAVETLQRVLALEPQNPQALLALSEAAFHEGDSFSAKSYLSGFADLPGSSSRQLQKAAELLSSLNEYAAEIMCLERAVALDASPRWNLLRQMAVAYQKADNLPAALETIQKAGQAQPDNPDLLVFQADLLANLEQNLASLDALRRALQAFSIGNKSITNNKLNITPSNIHGRIASLMNKIGKLNEALHHAEEAVKLDPDNLTARVIAVDLAYGQMDDVLALQLCQSWKYMDSSGEQTSLSESDSVDEVAGLLSVEASLIGQTDKKLAAEIIQYGSTIAPYHPHVLAMQTLLAIQDHNPVEASEALSKACSSFEARKQLEKLSSLPMDEEVSRNLQKQWTMLAIADAALAVDQWQKAIAYYQAAVKAGPQQPRSHVHFARALVRMAETQEIYQELKITSHAPGNHLLDQEYRHLFDVEINTALQLSKRPEASHWQYRGLSVYQPCPENISILHDNLVKPDDVAALLAALRRTGNLQDIQGIAEPYLDYPEVALQLAMALRDNDRSNSLELAANLSKANENNPVYLAFLAFLNQDDPVSAYQFIEKALVTWPDELEWQKFAGSLCTKVGDDYSALSHWQKIVELDPGDMNNHISLGQIYLDIGEFDQAVLSLEQASRLDQDNLSTWKLLAFSYLKSGNIDKARQAVVRALSLNKNDFESLLMSCRIDLAAGENDFALEKITHLLQEEPTNQDAQLLMVQTLKSTGQYGEALKMIDQTLPNISQPMEMLLEKASLIKQTQGDEAALPILLDLANNYPEQEQVLSLLSGTFSELGQYDMAEKTAQAALRLSPDDPQIHLLLGYIQRKKGQLDQSLFHLDEALRKTPRKVEIYLELGLVYQDRREHLNALKAYRQASEIDPDDFRPYYHAGLVLRESKDYIKAESMFRRAARLAPNDINVKRQLGAVITLNLVHNPQEAMISHEY